MALNEWPLPDRPRWWDRAACRGISPGLFTVSDRGYGSVPEGRRQRSDNDAAKQVCNGCTVAADCLQEGIEQNDKWTIRAGLTPAQRRPLRSQWIRTHPTTKATA